MKDGQYYINGILNNDSQIVKEIYSDCTNGVKRYVSQNQGSEDEAQDVIQDGLIIIYKKAKEGNLLITSSFSTYFYSVCRFVWLKKISKNKGKQVTLDEIKELEGSDMYEDKYLELEKRKIFHESFLKLPDECQQLMTMSFNKTPGTEIAEKMEYSIEYVKRKKYKCKEKLVHLVKSHSLFKDLF